ncbi:MAG: hypothetical protein ACI9CD_000629 [Candidatus Deianiraeaceae bacterium]|jgi:hypothetical protein
MNKTSQNNADKIITVSEAVDSQERNTQIIFEQPYDSEITQYPHASETSSNASQDGDEGDKAQCNAGDVMCRIACGTLKCGVTTVVDVGCAVTHLGACCVEWASVVVQGCSQVDDRMQEQMQVLSNTHVESHGDVDTIRKIEARDGIIASDAKHDKIQKDTAGEKKIACANGVLHFITSCGFAWVACADGLRSGMAECSNTGSRCNCDNIALCGGVIGDWAHKHGVSFSCDPRAATTRKVEPYTATQPQPVTKQPQGASRH